MDRPEAAGIVRNLIERSIFGFTEDERQALTIAWADLTRTEAADCRCALMHGEPSMTPDQKLWLMAFGACTYGVRMDMGDDAPMVDYVNELVTRFRATMSVIKGQSREQQPEA